MVTKSISKQGLPIWEFLNLPAHLHMGITIWKRGIHMGKHSHLGIFLAIPKQSKTFFWNVLVTEPSPYGNGPSLGINFKMASQNGISSPFGDSNLETGSHMF
jgi:hypothetical protein